MALSPIYGSTLQCLNMVKMQDVINSDLKDTGIASLKENVESIMFYFGYCTSK